MLQMVDTRRRFLAYFSGMGLGSTLLPGVLWARLQEPQAGEVTAAMVRQAAALAGLDVTEEQAEAMAEGANRNLQGYVALRQPRLPNDVAPPLHFSALVPGMSVDRVERPFRPTVAEGVRRPPDLEEAAFWPLTALAELVRTRQVTSVELTEMYLARLRRYDPKLHFVVTFTEELAREQARRADQELRAGQYRGPLHGIPWGAKDILAVRGYPTTWGSNAYKDQVTDHEATVVELLREAGAVLVAKLTTGELASGDRWFGGRTRNPWDAGKGSSGSSAGPASAAVAGCVGFAVGTETSGSILSPSVACGASGLRPTYGRVSRHGSMTLRWTGDRLGPIGRTAEDCALVLGALARPDERDPGVVDVPFNWDAGMDVRQLRTAYVEPAFEDDPGKGPDWRANDRATLDRLRDLGMAPAPVALPLPDFSTDALRPLSAESAAAFDDFLRDARDSELGRPQRAAGMRTSWTVPAVHYLQAQRIRGLMMRDLHEAMGDHDVYVAPYMDMRRSLAETPPQAPAPGGGEPPRRSPASHFFQLANIACWPAVAVRNGFGDDGLPTGITFVGRPFDEARVLAMAKAYQDSTDFHRRVPALDD